MPPSREGTAKDAIAGVVPRAVHTPATRRDAAELFKAAHARKHAVAPIGGGTELGLGAPPTRLDATVSSRRFTSVLEYAPPDQVVHVEAGVTLAALAGVLAKEGQRLAFDPPDGDRATIGGLLATNNFGPLRTRYGSLRDLLIGISVLRADGSVVHGGGKVVKNVAGFDIPKLMVGALGTLGMIETATFRLHPLPEIHRTIGVRGISAAQVRALVARMRDDQLEPAAVFAFDGAEAKGTFDAFVRFEGFAAGVHQQRDRFCAVLAELSRETDDLSAADAVARTAEHDARRTQGNLRMKIVSLPSALPAVAADVLPLLTAELPNARVVSYPTLGITFVTGDANAALEDGARMTSAITRARATLGPLRGALTVHACPTAMYGALDVWGPPPAAFALMKRVKRRFDPENRLNPGRFVGGL